MTAAPDITARAEAPPAASPRRWEGKRRGGRYGNLFFQRLVASRTGRALAPFFLFWVALYFLIAAPAARRVSFELARRVGRKGRLRFAFRHFFTFGGLLIDRLAMRVVGPEAFSFETFGEERMVAAAAEGRGLVVISAHLGNWELMGERLARYGLPMTIVMFDGVQPEVKNALSEYADRVGFEVLYTDGGPSAAAGMMAALARGRVLGMMGDRTFAGRAATVPFLGGEAEFPLGPYALAAASGAPMFHVFALRRARGRYTCYGHEVGVLRYDSRAQRQANLEAWASDFAARLEHYTRRAPDQWNNFYPFWKEPT